MFVISAKLTFSVGEADSLKDKRMVARSLIDGARHKFNAAIAEVDTQDVHRTLTIGVAVVSAGLDHANAQMDSIIRYMEARAELTHSDIWEG